MRPPKAVIMNSPPSPDGPSETHHTTQTQPTGAVKHGTLRINGSVTPESFTPSEQPVDNQIRWPDIPKKVTPRKHTRKRPTDNDNDSADDSIAEDYADDDTNLDIPAKRSRTDIANTTPNRTDIDI
ncbi:hypothetical protein N7457_006221 [Penicillium paradoxum]|uniref:uncharacterized protein n=1 Tax=Penicillium paradoxum TaxID=176176 RepID=UPI002548E418|nr:uncharacterized protein N7457_006221 [Penicillium paradoxum]KAJ5781061.1 hypothetical protein N7457_006221 [Penicillium paradoxum]